MNGSEAARVLGVSVRHVKRLKKRVKQEGAKGVIHGNRGKASNRRIPDSEREKIAKILKERYADFHPLHASEKLAEAHAIIRDPKTIRKIMIEEKLWKPKKGKKKQEHRQWRQRRSFYGEMEQFDGCYHAWLEERYEGKLCLLLSVDDATSTLTHGKFCMNEGIDDVFEFWQEYVKKHGKPLSIYMDKFSTYKMNHKEAQENPDTKTQFGRSLEQLGIGAIFANSPEAKGRVEVRFETLQNRLIKEMRLRNICTVEEANKYVQEEFMFWFNTRYGVAPRGEEDLHKPLTKKEEEQLPSIFSRHTERTVQNDFTISYKTQWYQILEKQSVTVQKKDKVIVEERRDKSIHVRLRGKYLNIRSIPKTQKKIKKTLPWVIAATVAPKTEKVTA